VTDPNTKAAITDYKWIIEQDLTFYLDPNCQQNGRAAPSRPPAGRVPPTLAQLPHQLHADDRHRLHRPAKLRARPVDVRLPAGLHTAGRSGRLQRDRRTARSRDLRTERHLRSGSGWSHQSTGLDPRPGGPDCDQPRRNPGALLHLGAAGRCRQLVQYRQFGADNVELLPADRNDPTGQSVPTCGHTMGGAPIPPPTCTTAGTTTTCTFRRA